MNSINVKFKEEIAATFLDLQKCDSPIIMRSVLENLKKEIADSYMPGDDLIKFERIWLSRIKQVAKTMNIELQNQSYEWKKIVGELKALQAESSEDSSLSTESSSALSIKMNLIDKQRVIEIYKQMDEEKMWRLSTGKVVELEMLKMAEICQFEHPCHSFILDTEDENWLDFFTSEEMKEIKSYNVRAMKQLPKELSDLLDSINQTDMDDLHKSLSMKYFHPKNEHACHWVQKSLLEGVELHMSDFLKIQAIVKEI